MNIAVFQTTHNSLCAAMLFAKLHDKCAFLVPFLQSELAKRLLLTLCGWERIL